MSKDTGNNNSLRRGLKGRHLQMIAIGGSIGTGLFLAMGGTIRDAGPGGAMVAYAIMSVVVYFMMTALGEMATELPIPGAFTSYANRFVDPAWGFTNGWAYWFGSSMTVAAELIASLSGIGYRMSNARSLMQSDTVIVCMLVIGVVGIIMDKLISIVFSLLTPWQKSNNK